MLRIDKIYVKKNPESIFTWIKLQNLLEKKLMEVASATKIRFTEDETKLTVNLGSSISLQTVNKLLNMLMDEKIKIKELHWKTMKVGIFDLGILELTVS